MHEPLDAQSVKAALITPQGPWQVVDVHASIDSTNLEALRDPLPWRVVVADFQSAGRGRLARQWQAPAGASIAVSVVVPVPVARAADVGWLPLLSGMAMQGALAEVAEVAARLKWPNDVLVQEGVQERVQEEADGPAVQGSYQGRYQGSDGATWLKISGILCETAPGAVVVIGAGANISQDRSELAVDSATSLVLCGAVNVRREDVVVAYLGKLADLHRTWAAGGAGLAALRAAYRSLCLTIGMDVDVHRPDAGITRGTATGVDNTGRLVVEAGGSSTVHAAGDVVHVRRAKPPAGDTA